MTRNTKIFNPADAYQDKPLSYFDTARQDYIDALEIKPEARILELGCGSGPTGELCLELEKCGEYVGIELSAEMAQVASEKLSRVIIGDIEEIEIDFPENYFDVLIMSEVLEHLRDPEKVVNKLLKKVKKGGYIMASSPNISHHRIVRYLLKGDWPLTDEGVMDRTHLRWFTPRTFENMFKAAGCKTKSIGPVSRKKLKYKLVNFISFGRWLGSAIGGFIVRRVTVLSRFKKLSIVNCLNFNQENKALSVTKMPSAT